jgi:hypothetical protein
MVNTTITSFTTSVVRVIITDATSITNEALAAITVITLPLNDITEMLTY